MPDEIMLSDEDIIALYFERNEEAISATDAKYGKYLYSEVLCILENREDSSECVNDVYLKTWNSIPPTVPRMLKAYLAKIARNTAFDRYDEGNRKKRIPSRRKDSLSDFEDFLVGSDPATEVECAEIGRIITKYLHSVSSRKMYIFMGRFYFAKPISEIAKKLKCSESTVNKEIAAIKKELRAELEREGVEL